MSVRIVEACVTCGACLWECPTEAITPGDPRPVVEEHLCTECFGSFGESQCVTVCPVDAIRVNIEPIETLAARFGDLHPQRMPANTAIWRRIVTGPQPEIAHGRRAPPAVEVPETGDGPSGPLSEQMVTRHPDVIWDRVDGELVVLHAGTGEFYTFNEVGAFIWDLVTPSVALTSSNAYATPSPTRTSHRSS